MSTAIDNEMITRNYRPRNVFEMVKLLMFLDCIDGCSYKMLKGKERGCIEVTTYSEIHNGFIWKVVPLSFVFD